jgi:hypothetical protein
MRKYGGTLYLFNMPAHTYYFKAFFLDELISGDSTTRTISIRFTDDLKSLTYMNPGTTIGEYKYLETFIKELLPNVSEVHFISDFRFKYNEEQNINGLQTYCYMHQIGALSSDVYHYKFVTKGDILKALLNSFASYGLIGFDRHFYILPLFFNEAPVYNIPLSNLEGTSEVHLGRVYKALANNYQMCWGNSKIEYKLAQYGELRRFNNLNWSEDDQIKQITTLFSVGDDANLFPVKNIVKRTWATNLFYLHEEGNLRYLFANKVAYKKADGTYSEEKSLSQWASNLIFENISGVKRTLTETVPGINYNFLQYYTREGINAVFRPKSIGIDYENDQTKLVLQECVNADQYLYVRIVTFKRILRAFNWSCTIKKKINDKVYNYMTEDGEGYSTNSDVPYLGQESIIIKIKNAFNCGLTLAYEFDGIQIAIPEEELDVWKDDWTYVIYLAIGKNKNVSAPASSYPVEDDANVNWFYLDTITDLKNNDSSYYYQYTVSTKKIQTKYPYWIWVGLKSSHATLFDNIPMLGK